MKHDPFCLLDECLHSEYEHVHCPYCPERCICKRLAAARADERVKVVEVITDRIDDLRTCNRTDECESHAKGAELALEDLRESWEAS